MFQLTSEKALYRFCGTLLHHKYDAYKVEAFKFFNISVVTSQKVVVFLVFSFFYCRFY